MNVCVDIDALVLAALRRAHPRPLTAFVVAWVLEHAEGVVMGGREMGVRLAAMRREGLVTRRCADMGGGGKYVYGVTT